MLFNIYVTTPLDILSSDHLNSIINGSCIFFLFHVLGYVACCQVLSCKFSFAIRRFLQDIRVTKIHDMGSRQKDNTHKLVFGGQIWIPYTHIHCKLKTIGTAGNVDVRALWVVHYNVCESYVPEQWQNHVVIHLMYCWIVNILLNM